MPAVAAGLPLDPGDIVSVRTAGGGGYGDPLDREPSRVLTDLVDGRISPEAANRIYGVVVRDGVVDAQATKRLRQGLRRKRPGTGRKPREAMP